MPYSAIGDLLLGDILLKPGFDKQKFVNDAADEMDSKLGWRYALPLRVEGVAPPGTEDSWKDLPQHQVLLLKTINNRLASGRLILTLDMAGEQTTLHAYGWSLIQEALKDLIALANGDAVLDAEPMTPASAFTNKAPSITNPDEESLLLGFENTVMRNTPWYSRPGAV